MPHPIKPGERFILPPPEQGDCHVCNSKEWEAFQKGQTRRENERTVQLFLKWSDIGPSYLSCTFENFDARPGTELAGRTARQFVEEFAAPGGQWLLLFGGPGGGKTHLGMAIRGEVERNHVCQALAVTQPFLLNQIRATWNRRPGDDPDARSEDWMMDRLLHAKFLLWDDLMNWPEWADDRMFALIDGRYRGGRKTVFTSNHDPDQLEHMMGPRLWSRFVGRTRMVPVTATDYRKEVERHNRFGARGGPQER